MEPPEVAPGAPAGTEASPPAAGGTQLAASAAQGLPADALLGLAQGAARLHAPLTAALAVERLRQATHVAPKEEFAELATQVNGFRALVNRQVTSAAVAGCSLCCMADGCMLFAD